MKKQILVSGLRASSEPHIGNYLGAIKQFVEKQDDYDCYFFIADLHTLTTPFDPKELRKAIVDVVASYLAAGLDPKKCTLFLQSQIAEHSELAWVLECITPIGELFRMTQFKEKAALPKSKNIFEKGKSLEELTFIDTKKTANAGLLSYPVLMAADVLLYKAEVVPVGEDQLQHLELARDISREFNKLFGKTFPEPKALLNKTARVKSLADPAKKMSKTGGEGILLSDEPEAIRKKLRKAVSTDEGIKNLLFLLSEFGKPEQVAMFEKAFKDGTLKNVELKDVLAEEIANYFAVFRKKRKELLNSPDIIAKVLADGGKKAKAAASETMSEVKKKIGLI